MKRFMYLVLCLLVVLGLFQPAYHAKAAANNFVITPLSEDWLFVNDNGTVGDWVTGFEDGPASAPLGNGSVTIELTSALAGVVFGAQKYQGTFLSEIQSLSYSTYTNLSPAAMTFQINYDPDITTVEEATWYGRLTYEPYMNDTVVNGVWQTWDMLNGGSGLWWASPNANSPVDNDCPQAAPCTWDDIIASYPNIGIRNDALSFIQFKAGSNWNGFAGNVDNFTIGLNGDTDTYDFEPLSMIYVDDSWSAVTEGDDPDGTGPALKYGTDSFDTIQKGIDAVSAGGTVQVFAGTYTEDLLIDKAMTLLGPNQGINPNTGVRSGEAVVHPATSIPDPFAASGCTVVAYLSVSNITIDGFTFDGDNPALTSGVTLGSADVDACEILAGYEGMGNIVVENNILKNSTYTGIDFYNYTNSSATAGNFIRFNKFEDIGTITYGYGIGILIYNNFYADITNNVMNNVRIGIQTGNFSQANPGVTGSISNNEINSWRLGIFHNLWYSNASNFLVANNDIHVEDNPDVTRWVGLLLSSFSVPATIQNNIITATAVTQETVGHMVWNDYLASGLAIEGGSVTGADYGVWVNNYAGYTSNANNTAITVDGVSISGSSLAGVYVQDDPLNTNGATVAAEIINSPITNSMVGILIEGTDVSATGMCNQITGNTDGLNNTASTIMIFEKNWWGSVTGPSGSGTGTGDSVSTNVDYSPWSTDTTCTAFTTNQAPVITEGASINVTMSEDGSPIGFDLTLHATDPETDTLTWSILTPASHGTASVSGTGDTKVVNYAPALNYSGLDSFVVQVSDGLATDTITVNVTINAVNTAPTDIDLSNVNIDENLPVSTVIGTFSTTDPDVGDSFTYSFCGGTDDAAFNLNGNELLSAEVFDYETKSSYSICIQTTDSGALSFTKTFNITVNNLIDTTSFADVPTSYWAWSYIESIYAAGITGGCGTSPLIYCPEQSVTRAQMAVFLLRGMHGSSYTPPAATGTVFNDVPLGSFAGAWIEQLVSEGITSGCGGGNYCPNGLVTRAQMSVFLLRAKYGSGYTPPAATGTVFNDVPLGSFAAAWIEQLVAEGVTSGCGGGNYCPENPITRAQMAIFLQRIFNLPLP